MVPTNQILWIDFETYSEADLKKVGATAYANHPSTEITVMSYAIGDADAGVIDMTDPNRVIPRALQNALVDPGWYLAAHNAQFDRTVANTKLFKRPTSADRWICTMGMALSHSLPAGLDALGTVLGLPEDSAKLKFGRRLVLLFCKPSTKKSKLMGGRATRLTHPAEWADFMEYARRDVIAMRECYRKMPHWNDVTDRSVYLLDQKINARGFAVDLELAKAAIAHDAAHRDALGTAVQDVTFGQVESATQRAEVLDYLVNDLGISVKNLQASTLERLLSDGGLPPAAEELIRIRLDSASTTASKYKIVLDGSWRGRMYDGLQYCGASRTGRWSGRRFQPQNMARPRISADAVGGGIAALKAGCADLVADDIGALLVSALRGCIIAEPGKKLLVADLSNIEGRVLAWLAGEGWKVQAFRDVDAGVGHDLYVLAYARSFRVDPAVVVDNKKHGDGKMRQIGKVQELALGYQGGKGAFATMAATYRLNLDGLDTNAVVQAWRKAHPAITALWYELQDAFVRAMTDGATTRVAHGKLVVDRFRAWIRVRLPSGRFLSYPSPKYDAEGNLSYMGVNQYTRRWERLKTYGGKLTENVVQAISRDVLAHGCLACDAAGLPIVLTIHDEILAETPPDRSVGELASAMTSLPDWAKGLPLAAAGFETNRYRKD